MAASAPATNVCRIRRFGQVAVAFGLPRAIRRRLITSLVDARWQCRGSQVVLERVGRPLIHPHSAYDGFIVPAGLIPVLAALLAEEGIGVEISSDLPAWGSGGSETGPLAPLFRAIIDRPNLLVRHPAAGFDRLGIVTDLCGRFADHRVAVVATRIADAREAAWRLRVTGFDAGVARGGSTLRDESHAIWVLTQRGIGSPQAEAHRAGLVVVLDALEAVGEVGLPGLRQLRAAHLVGLLAADVPLSPWDRDAVANCFGTEPVTLKAGGVVTSPVRVVTVPFGGPIVPTTLEGFELKTAGLIHHRARNRRLARLVRLLVDDCRDRLALEFPNVLAVGGRGVLVLVDTVAHAEVLAGFLPGAPVVTASRPKTLPNRPRVAVVTPDGLARLGPITAGVVVRADGGVGLPPGLTADLMPDARAVPELLVVDVRDRHHPELRRRHARRVREYARAGWAIGPTDRAGLAAFLLTRPPGRGR